MTPTADALRPRVSVLGVFFGALLLTAASVRGETQPPSTRRPPEPESRSAPMPRPPEGLTEAHAPVDGDETPLLLLRDGGAGCALGQRPALIAALLDLPVGADPLLTLEAWTDAPALPDGAIVPFRFRAARDSLLTLFWIGPGGDVFVALRDLRVPGRRDLQIETGAAITPPLGRERWVAIASAGPLLFPCAGTETRQRRWVDSLEAIPHAVTRWELRSVPAVSP